MVSDLLPLHRVAGQSGRVGLVAALAFVKGMEVAALSIIVLFVCSIGFNNTLMGLKRNKTLFIISVIDTKEVVGRGFTANN